MKQLGFKNLVSNNWAKDRWISNGTLVLPRGYGQQIRGQLYGSDRPDLIIVDDLEDSEGVLSDEQRAKKKEWFFGDVLGAVDASKYHKIVYIGNMLHEDCLLANLLENPDWVSFRYPIADDDMHSLWPEKYSDEYIAKLYRFYKNEHLLDVFYREYMCQSMAREGAPFDSKCFQYYSPEELKKLFVEFVVLVDPAKSTGSSACDTAVVGVGIDALNNRFYVHDIDYGRWHPNEIVDNAMAMCQRLGARVLGVEEAGSGEFISWPIKNELRRRAANVEYVKLTPRKGPSQYVPNGSSQQGKDSRIGHALVGLYRNGLVYHNREHRHVDQLERQLLEFPRGKRKDIIDALSYVAQLMETGERYFACRRYVDDDKDTEYGPGMLDAKYEDARLKELCAPDSTRPEPWQV
jgi:phage terminase large subunit-like protein